MNFGTKAQYAMIVVDLYQFNSQAPNYLHPSFINLQTIESFYFNYFGEQGKLSGVDISVFTDTVSYCDQLIAKIQQLRS